MSIVGCGVMMARCLEPTKHLVEAGASARLVEMHTIKPLDRELVVRCAAGTGALVTVEVT